MTATNLGAMFRLFGLAFEIPTPKLVNVIVDGSLRKDMREIWMALELPQEPIEEFYDTLAIYEGRDEEELLHELRRETTRLYLGDHPVVANTEGIWRKKAEGKINPVFMINSYSTEVSDFMRYCGVVKSQGYNDSVDFIWTECEFAGFLADNPPHLAEKGLDASELLDQFIDNHLKLWVPGFCKEVVEGTKVAYYRSLCSLMGVFIGDL